MRFRLLIMLLLAAPALPVAAQEGDHSAVVDTTMVLEDGTKIRYRGPVLTSDQPAGDARNEALRDERVPLGYGWKTLRTWREGDLRPAPVMSEGRITTEFVDLYYSRYLNDDVALGMAEHMDYAWFAVKDNLGWVKEGPLKVWTPYDAKEYAATYGLAWWLPGDMWEDGIVLEPISMITARGIALEVLTRLYVEWHIREKTGDRVPYWFMYGAGAMFGNEGWILKGQVDVLGGIMDTECDQATMIRDLELFRDGEMMRLEAERPGSREDERNRSRVAFWRAYRLVENVILNEGVSTFRDLIAAMETNEDLSFESAVQRSYGKSLAALIADNEPW